MEDLLDETFQELQRLSAEKLHELGDLLLPTIAPSLAGLRKHGLNTEGKTRKGTPDSFVGDSARTCRVAVEYSTQATGVEGKLRDDFGKVRQHCPTAREIALCTNRSLEGKDLDSLKGAAAQNGVQLQIIDGRELTRVLCSDRQDLRARFLNIPIGAHTILSLTRGLARALDEMGRGRVDSESQNRFVPRPKFDRVVRDASAATPGRVLLLTAPAGFGKTTWSFDYARRHADDAPVFWVSAKELALTQVDPLSIAVVHASYGTPDAHRVAELADLLRRERRCLHIVLEGIDEVRDYAALADRLKSFRRSRLASVSSLLLTCRAEAVPLLERYLRPSLPEAFGTFQETGQGSSGKIRLPEFDAEQATALLRKSGATDGMAREVARILPPQFRGNPLFLLRSLERARAGLPAPNGDDNEEWIEGFASDFVTDIAARMHSDGRAPRKTQIRTFLEEMAKQALTSPSSCVPPERLGEIRGADEEGENTLLERAVQAGVLRYRPEGVGFSHSLFFEHFAAAALSKFEIGDWLRQLQGDGRRDILVRLVALQPDPSPLISYLLTQDPVAACEVAARLPTVGDSTLRQAIVAAAVLLLKGRFLSDRARGLRLLSGLKWPEATAQAGDWFNGLPAEAKRDWLADAAELFLAHEAVDAFRVVVGHADLAFNWYEPSFVRRITSLSPAFQRSLTERARGLLSKAKDRWHRQRLTKFLAILGDRWLVDHLRDRLAGAAFEEHDYRALLHLNSEESILLYAEAVEACLQAEDQARRLSGYDTYLSKSTDILMFDYGALKELVASALLFGNDERAAFAIEWAAFMGDDDLLLPAYQATRRFNGLWLMMHGLVENILKRGDAKAALALYGRYEQPAIRGAIVHNLHVVGGQEVVTFLLERLNDDEHQFSAIQALGFLGARGAGPMIQALLKSPKPDIASMAARVLGDLRFAPAVDDLVQAMKASHVYGAIRALGKIGGAVAYREIASHFESAQSEHDRGEVLEALVRRREPEGLTWASIVVERSPIASDMIASAIGHPDIDARIRGADELEPLIRDERLLEHVLASARRRFATGYLSLDDYSIRGVACFDGVAAIEFLEEVASAPATGNLLDPTLDAKHFLALRGHKHFPRSRIDWLLDRTNKDAPTWNLNAYSRWPAAVVREALLERIAKRDSVVVWFELLQFFATDEDLELFREHESDDDEEVADLCHRILNARYRMAEIEERSG